MKFFKFSIFFLLFLLAATACNKDPEAEPMIEISDSARQPFIGDWDFTMQYYFEGFVYDSLNDTTIYTNYSDTIWMKQGSIEADPYSHDGLVVNYGSGEEDFTITTDGLYVTCISGCTNAGWDTLGPYAAWWYLAEGTQPYDSAAIYNLGVHSNASYTYSIVGYPDY